MKKAYRIKWSDGTPCLEIGELVECGKKRKYMRARFGKTLETRWADSVEQAIFTEAGRLASYYGLYAPSNINKNRRFSPDVLLGCIPKLLRMYVKMARHGIIK